MQFVDFLIFLYFAIFPLGQLLKFGLFNLSDLVVGLACVIFLLSGKKSFKPVFWYFGAFLVICFFSLIFSLSFFPASQVFTGLLYLVRFAFYILLGQIVWWKFGQKQAKRESIFNALILVGCFVAAFGWIQYLVWPDLRALKALRWDDHYFRMVSTFLDPAFTGIILVLTEMLVLIKTIKVKTKFNFLLNIFLVFTIAFTYSRASFLALFGGIIFLFLKFRKKFLILTLVLFVGLIPLLPKPAGEGVNLARTYSIVDRFENYKDGLVLFSKSPIFGIGFDNVCVAKEKFLGERDLLSHSCSGLDNGLIFVVATTGIIGFFLFVKSIYSVVKHTKFDFYGWGLITSLVVVFIHGSFSNTWFYNFVLGWIFILVGVTRKKFKG